MRLKALRTATIALSIAALLLEILPYGAVLNFAMQGDNGSIETVRKSFSYFDLTPYGYANFGPFLTAIMTCVIFILSLLFFFRPTKCAANALKVVSLIAFITSLLPVIMFGISFYPSLGLIISVILASEFVVCMKIRMI